MKLLDLGDPEAFAKFFAGFLNFALFPDDSRPMHAPSNSHAPAQGASTRISHQVREHLAGQESERLALMGPAISMVDCALSQAPSTMKDLYEMRKVVCGRRMEAVRLRPPHADRSDTLT